MNKIKVSTRVLCSYTGQNKYIASNVKTIVSNCGSLFIALLNHYVGPERQFNFGKILRIFKDNYIQNCYKVAEMECTYIDKGFLIAQLISCCIIRNFYNSSHIYLYVHMC